MATITLNVDDKINNEFRQIVKSKFGEGKGKLGSAFEEAIKKWIFEQQQKEIADRQLKLMKQGLYSLNGYKFNREEIYEGRGNISH